ncbi:MAG: molybdopterin-dependent oxidoreductase [Chloroflexi bacterium]|nr:molybdopterin-dependent oxidoreductase [Chloroflexota bacterium]
MITPIANEEKIVKSNCRGCHGGCGVLVTVKDGVIDKIEGDPDFPTNHGSLCSKGLAFKQLVYHPDRLHYPLKRAGKRGEGKWERITWDEALDTIAQNIYAYKAEFGAESIVLAQGTSREFESFLSRFANLLGTPNVMGAGYMCYLSRVAIALAVCGKLPIVDYEGDPQCVIVWGSNIVWNNADEYTGENLMRVLKQGSKLIVVDPRLTYLAGRADVWLQLRPGTDTALMLGIANVIIQEELYDKEFVAKYIHGWDEFCKRAREYPLDQVEQITWVPQEKIRQAARLFAQTKPSAIQWGVAIEQSINCIDNDRTLIYLLAMTGNLDAKGGNVFYTPPKAQNIGQFAKHDALTDAQRAKMLGGDIFRLAARINVITPKMVWNAILTGQPYPVKAVLIHGSNPVVTRENAREVHRALSAVEFLTVSDFFMTPTAELADIVLPAATWLEADYLGGFFFRHGYIFPRKKIVQIGECKSDFEIFHELGKRVGQEDWEENIQGDLDAILKPAGLKWDDVKEMPFLRGPVAYRKHEQKGFSTPTRKVEFYSTVLAELKYDPLPRYQEIPESPVSRPDMTGDYPYILITGARTPVFFHSEHRMVPWLRELHPDPIVELHPDTAAKHSIKEGDWVYIQSPRGRIKQRAKLTTGIDARVVAIQHGWWFPEVKSPDHGWDVSNSNILTDSDPKGYDQAMGATNLRVLMCNIDRVEEGK